MDLVVLLFVVAITSVALVGWGYVGLNLIGLDRPKKPDVCVIWLGFSLVLVLVQVAHLVLPVDWKLSILFAAIGLATFLAYHGSDLHRFASLVTSAIAGRPLSAAVISVFILLCSAHAMATPWNYDSGLYHFAKIRWLNEYPIVPGLGNLHGRLAFNQCYFGFVALMNVSPYWNHGHGAANLFLFLLTIATILHVRLHRMVGGFWVLAVLAITIAPLARKMAPPVSDYVVALLQIVIFVLLIKISVKRGENNKDIALYAVVAIILSVIIVTVKLSAAMFGVTTLVIALVMAAKELKKNGAMTIRTLALCLVIGIVYISRGYIESGVPFYPSTFAGMWELEWAIPVEAVRNEASWILRVGGWTGVPRDEGLGNWDWNGLRLSILPFREWIILGTAFAMMLSDLILARRIPTENRFVRGYALYLPLLASLLFWLFTSPLHRFLGSIPELFLLLSGWLVVRRLYSPTHGMWQDLAASVRDLKPSYSPSFLFVVASLFLMVNDIGVKKASTRILSDSVAGWREIPSVATEVRETESGLKVLIPESGDQCWNAPLPCTPYFRPALRTRHANNGTGDLSHGFCVAPPESADASCGEKRVRNDVLPIAEETK